MVVLKLALHCVTVERIESFCLFSVGQGLGREFWDFFLGDFVEKLLVLASLLFYFLLGDLNLFL